MADNVSAKKLFFEVSIIKNVIASIFQLELLPTK